MADIWAQLARYRQLKVLPDGMRVLLDASLDPDTILQIREIIATGR